MPHVEHLDQPLTVAEINLLQSVVGFHSFDPKQNKNAVMVDTLRRLSERLSSDRDITYSELALYSVGLPQAIRGYVQTMQQHAELDENTASICRRLLKLFHR